VALLSYSHLSIVLLCSRLENKQLLHYVISRRARQMLQQLAERLLNLSALDADNAQLPLRGLVERMAQLAITVLLLEQAESELQKGPEGTGRRKLLIAQLYIRRHLLVHPDGWAANDDPTPLTYFHALVDWQYIA